MTRFPVVGSLSGIVAKVVGLPGFIDTRPKWMVPPSFRSMVGLSKSSSPMETPPVVITTSTLANAERSFSSRVPALCKESDISDREASCQLCSSPPREDLRVFCDAQIDGFEASSLNCSKQGRPICISDLS